MLILASASPRRRDLLTQIALPHIVRPAHIDEARLDGEDPVAYVRRLALEKASSIAGHEPEATILGADTTVVLGGEILNKPVDLPEAERMLRALAGRTHFVHTGIAAVHGSRVTSHVETTAVSFTDISGRELAAYLATGDSLDKAGAIWYSGLRCSMDLARRGRLLQCGRASPRGHARPVAQGWSFGDLSDTPKLLRKGRAFGSPTVSKKPHHPHEKRGVIFPLSGSGARPVRR